MADATIHALTDGTAPALTDEFPISRSPFTAGFDRKLTWADILAGADAYTSAYNAKNQAYGAVGDRIDIADAAITAGSHTLTSASGLFTAAHVGKTIAVANAGGTTATTATLVTTISGFTNSTTVTLTAAAGNTVTAAQASFGTDDTAALNLWLAALASDVDNLVPPSGNVTGTGRGGDCLLPRGKFLINGPLMVPFAAGFVIRGVSRHQTWIRQAADNTPIFKFTYDRSIHWTIEKMYLDYVGVQPSTNTTAAPIYFSTPTIAGCFNFLIQDASFDRCCDCVGGDSTGQVWGGAFRFLRVGSNVTRSLVTLLAGGATNNRFDHIYILANSMVGPIFKIASQANTRIDAIEINNAALAPQIIAFSGGVLCDIGTIRIEGAAYVPYGTSATYITDISNGGTVSTAAITSGQNTLTVTGGSFTPNMVGWTVKVQGAGAAGGDLTTTITGWVSATQVKLAANASTTVGPTAVAIYGNNSNGNMFAPGNGTLVIESLELRGITVCPTDSASAIASTFVPSLSRPYMIGVTGAGSPVQPVKVNSLFCFNWTYKGTGTYYVTDATTTTGDVEIGSLSYGLPIAGAVTMSSTGADPGDTLTVGSTVYTFKTTLTETFATGTISDGAGQPANNDTVTIAGKVYTFQTTLTNVDGHVHIGATAAATMTNLKNAINNSGGTPGTDYANNMTANASVTATVNVTSVNLTNKVVGVVGNSTTLAKSSATVAISGATLAGGVDPVANEIHRTGVITVALNNLQSAINGTGTPGTDYSSTTVANPYATCGTPDASTFTVLLTAVTPENSLPLDVTGTKMTLGGFRLTDIVGTTSADAIRVLSWNRDKLSGNIGDSDTMVLPGSKQANILSYETALTAARTVNLPRAGAAGSDLFDGYRVRVVRGAGGAFNLNVNHGLVTLASIAAPTSAPSIVEFTYRRAGASKWVQTMKQIN